MRPLAQPHWPPQAMGAPPAALRSLSLSHSHSLSLSLSLSPSLW